MNVLSVEIKNNEFFDILQKLFISFSAGIRLKKVIFYLIIEFVSIHAMYSMNLNKKLENKSFVKIGKNQEVDTTNILQTGIVQQAIKAPIKILYMYKNYHEVLGQCEVVDQPIKKLEEELSEALNKKTCPTCDQYFQKNRAEDIRCLLYRSTIDVNEVNEDGETSFFEAIKNCDEKVVSILLRHESIDVNKADNGIPPLLLAAYYGYKNIVKLLLKHGADFSYSLHNEKTAHDIAVENNYEEIVLLLDFYKYMVDQKLENLLFCELQDISLEELQDKIPSNYILEYLFFIAQNENQEKQAQKMYDEFISFFS